MDKCLSVGVRDEEHRRERGSECGKVPHQTVSQPYGEHGGGAGKADIAGLVAHQRSQFCRSAVGAHLRDLDVAGDNLVDADRHDELPAEHRVRIGKVLCHQSIEGAGGTTTGHS